VDYRVITADNHVNEAPDTFDRLPEKFRDRQPRIMPGVGGGEGWSFDGKPPRSTFGLAATAGHAHQEYKVSGGWTLDEIRPGNYDGSEALKDLDIDGVDAAVLFPGNTLSTFTMADREFAQACIHAYNDWLLDEFCSADPNRLFGLPILPVDDGGQAMLGEAQRVVNKGAHGVYLPYFPKRQYYDPYYETLWKLLAEAGVAATIHRTLGGKGPDGEAVMGNVYPSDERPGIGVAGMVERNCLGPLPLTRMIFTGVFERHPNLRFVSAEVGGGWVPFWAQLMDQMHEIHQYWANPPISESPSSYVGRNVFVSCLDDYVGFELAKTDETLARAVMWSSNYAHSATTWPHSKDDIAKLTESMDPNLKHAILAGNAVRVFALNGK